MSVALLDLRNDGTIIADEDVAIKVFPSKEDALAWFKATYEPDPDYSEGATDEFNETLAQLTEHGSYDSGDGQVYIIKELEAA